MTPFLRILLGGGDRDGLETLGLADADALFPRRVECPVAAAHVGLPPEHAGRPGNP